MSASCPLCACSSQYIKSRTYPPSPLPLLTPGVCFSLFKNRATEIAHAYLAPTKTISGLPKSWSLPCEHVSLFEGVKPTHKHLSNPHFLGLRHNHPYDKLSLPTYNRPRTQSELEAELEAVAEPDIPSHRASFPQPAPACLFFLSLSQKSLRGSNHSLNQTRLSQETGTLNKKERKDRESHTSRGKEPPPHNIENNAQGIKKKSTPMLSSPLPSARDLSPATSHNSLDSRLTNHYKEKC